MREKQMEEEETSKHSLVGIKYNKTASSLLLRAAHTAITMISCILQLNLTVMNEESPKHSSVLSLINPMVLHSLLVLPLWSR